VENTPATRRVEVRFTDAEFAALARLASELDTSIADAARYAIANEADPESELDADRGLLPVANKRRL
jgi:hypothetical protein